MKKIKNAVGLIICVTMFSVFALGSGSSDTGSGVDKEISSVETTNSNGSETDKQEADDTSAGDDKSDDKTSSDAVTVEEQVVLDQNDVKVTVTGMDSGLFGPELKLLIENNSSQALTFQVRDASVNGYMADTMISEDVAAGKKSNTDIKFSASGLAQCGITTFTDMEFKFHIFDSGSWDTYLDSDVITVKTSADGSHIQEIDDSGEVFYDADGIKIIGKGLSAKDSVFGPGLIVYIENNTNKGFTVQVRDTSVNGFMIDTSMSQDVVAGKRAITAVTFFSSSLEENGITDIESIETSFHVFEMEGWDTIVDTDPITINF